MGKGTVGFSSLESALLHILYSVPLDQQRMFTIILSYVITFVVDRMKEGLFFQGSR